MLQTNGLNRAKYTINRCRKWQSWNSAKHTPEWRDHRSLDWCSWWCLMWNQPMTADLAESLLTLKSAACTMTKIAKTIQS